LLPTANVPPNNHLDLYGVSETRDGHRNRRK